MQITKNQHYVPRFYLKNFSQNKISIGMFRYKGRRLVDNASIRQVAYREYLYGKDNIIEKWLSECEGNWSKVINFLLAQDEGETPENFTEYYILLLQFVAISLARTAKVADGSKSWLDYMKVMFDEAEAAGRKLAFSKEDFFKNYDCPNAIPIDVANDSLELLADLTPVTIINETSRGFITSDNPVILYNLFYAYRKYNVNYGLGTSGIIIFLPLNEKVSFCLYDSEIYSLKSDEKESVVISSINQINELNKLFAMNAYETIFWGESNKSNYIQRIAEHMREPTPFVREYQVLGSRDTILRYGDDSIQKQFQIPIFRIKVEYKNIPLPNTLGGLSRKGVKEFQERYDKTYGIDRTASFRITQ